MYASGWQYKLSHVEWESIDNPEEAVYKARSVVVAREESTGIITIARDASQMAELLSLYRKGIRRAAFTRGNSVYHGYRFRLGFTNEPWPTFDAGNVGVIS